VLLSIVFFAVVIYIMGLATIQLATGRYRLSFEMHVACTGVGLATFAVVAVLLNTFHVALTWWTFLLSACGLFVLASLRDILAKDLPKRARAQEPFWSRDARMLLVVIGLAVVMLVVFLHGAFLSEWLTDDDSWMHATSARYVAMEQTYSVSPDRRAEFVCYLEPYPPAYPTLMGVLHQLNPSVYRTLKVFNTLIVSLGVVYFYLMVKQWTKRPVAALWMTGILWVLPCFMSHFIWSQSLLVVLMLLAFWALERARGEPRWHIVAAVVIASICLTQTSGTVVFGLLALIYWTVNLVFAVRKTNEDLSVRAVVLQALAGAGGVALSLIYYVPTAVKYGFTGLIHGVTRSSIAGLGVKVTGSGRGITYGLTDFIWAPLSSHIAQPTGLGLVLFLLACAGVVLFIGQWEKTRQSRARITALAWLVFTVLGVLANYFPVGLFPHRFWVFLALPVAMICGEGLSFLTRRLSGRYTVLAAAAGATLGATAVLLGLGEAVYQAPAAPLAGWRLAAALLAGLLTVGVVMLSLYVLIQQSAGSTDWETFSATVLIVAGIAVTSGFAKTGFLGFTYWDPGRFFYSRVEVKEDRRPVLVQNHLFGYHAIRKALRPKTPVWGLTCHADHIIGFDLATPPLDVPLKKFRRWLRDVAIEELTDQTAKDIHQRAVDRKFHFVTVDHYWASFPRRWHIKAQLAQRQLMRASRISLGRLKQLDEEEMQPTPLEEPFLDQIKEQADKQSHALDVEKERLAKIARLLELLEASPLFEKRFNSQPFGVTLFEVMPAEEQNASP